jgi:PAS domain S-box-containing protein
MPLQYSLFGQKNKLLFGKNDIHKHDPLSTSIQLSNEHWTLAAYPVEGWGTASAGELRWFWFIGLLIVSLFTGLGYSLLRQNRYLKEDISLQSHALQDAMNNSRETEKLRKLTETKLVKSEERYRTFIEQIDEGVFRIEFNEPVDTSLPLEEQAHAIIEGGIIAECNNAFLSIHGLSSPEVIVGCRISEFYQNTNNDELVENTISFIQSEYSASSLEFELRISDDSMQYFLMNSVGVIKNGKLHRIWVTETDITSRKQLEEDFLARKNKLDLALGGAKLSIWDWDLRSDRITYDSYWLDKLGYDHTEFQAEYDSWIGLVHPEDRPRVSELMEKHKSGRLLIYESRHRLRTKNHTYIWVLDRGMIVEKDEEGHPIKSAGTHLEITDQVLTEKRLIETNDLLNSALESSPFPIAIIDLEYIVMSWNPAAEELFGYSAEDIIGKHYPLVDPERQNEFQRHVQQVADKRQTISYHTTRIKSSREKVLVEINASPFFNSEGKIRGIMFIFQDLTTKKEQEAYMRLLSSALNAAADGVIIADRLGEIQWVNPAVTTMTGYRSDELIGENTSILKSGEHDKEFYEDMWGTILSGESWQNEVTNRRKDGSSYINLINITPVTDESGWITHFIAIASDVTERKQLQEELFQSQKLEAIGQLAAGIAHDFNNLLTIINGYSSILSAKAPEGSKEKTQLQSVHEAGEKAADLTRQLLAFSRKQRMETEVFNINEIIMNLSKMLQRLIGEDVSLETSLFPDIGMVKVDRGQIEQALINLSLNARDAMPQGGTILISTDEAVIPDTHSLDGFNLSAATYCRIQVTDTGCGIEQDALTKIFQPFYTTKEEGKGTGLGLSTVYGIIEQSGGDIIVNSSPDVGTTFEIYLPYTQEKEEPESKPENMLNDLRGSGSILVVDDEETVRVYLATVLEDYGFDVYTASAPPEAIETIQNAPRPLSLIITDIVMPQMNGIEFGEQIQKDVPVLFISGYTDGALAERVGELPQEHFLRKPFSVQTLLEKVQGFMN